MELKTNIFSVGALDQDRKLFDEIIPLPDGTSYNSYLIKGSDKIALIDTVDPEKEDVLIKNLRSLDIKKIDFIIANHAEQDHSGAIPKVLKLFPGAIIICSEKCKQMLIDHIGVKEDNIRTIKDNETLSLGDKTLRFIYTPWVHWPETMSTYLEEDKILFSCDFFGSHFATEEMFAKGRKKVYEGAKRYYAEIMMPFRAPIQNNLKKLSAIDIDMIAPSHGPVYDEPSFIIDAYKGWVSDDVKNMAIIVYVSMHGSTKKIVDSLSKGLEEEGIEVKIYNLINYDIGEFAIDLVDAATLIIATPSFLIGAHPAAANITYLINALRPKTRFISIVGSFGWGSKAIEHLQSMLSSLRVDMLEPLMTKGLPTEEEKKKIKHLSQTIAEKHKSLSLI